MEAKSTLRNNMCSFCCYCSYCYTERIRSQKKRDQTRNLLIVVNCENKSTISFFIYFCVGLGFIKKLEDNMYISLYSHLYSYFILQLNNNKEKLSLLRKWSLSRDSHATPRHILSPMDETSFIREVVQKNGSCFMHKATEA